MNVYLDNSATTKPSAAVAAAALQRMESGWYNPSALYKPAMEIQKQIDRTREICLKAAGAGKGADLLGGTSGRVSLRGGDPPYGV